MYAIVDDRGKQYKMVPGEEVVVDLLAGQDEVRFDNVMLVRTDAGLSTGEPYVSGASVTAEVVEHFDGEKIIIGKYKRRKKYRRRTGHRQPYSRVLVKEILTA